MKTILILAILVILVLAIIYLVKKLRKPKVVTTTTTTFSPTTTIAPNKYDIWWASGSFADSSCGQACGQQVYSMIGTPYNSLSALFTDIELTTKWSPGAGNLGYTDEYYGNVKYYVLIDAFGNFLSAGKTC